VKPARFNLTDHLEELRVRLFWILGTLAILCFFTFSHAGQVLDFIARDVPGLVYLSPTEAFWTYLKITVFLAVVLALPVLFWHFWRFVSAGLQAKEKWLLLLFIPFSVVLFAMGCGLSIFGVIPLALKFLLSFSTEHVKPMISLSHYITFYLWTTLAFGLVFELPIAMLVLAATRLMTPAYMRHIRPYVIVGIFVSAGILTPGPDIVSQLLMAIPMLFLYELGIVLSWFFFETKKKMWFR
jgi:sec-independent protein translocase protein TatC